MPSRRMAEVLIGAAALAVAAPLVVAVARLALRTFLRAHTAEGEDDAATRK